MVADAGVSSCRLASWLCLEMLVQFLNVQAVAALVHVRVMVRRAPAVFHRNCLCTIALLSVYLSAVSSI